MKSAFLYLSPFFCFLNSAFAQDAHWAQYYNTIAYNNPAQIGLYNGYAYQRAVLAYRNQWASVPVPYNTAFLAFDRQVKLKGMRNNSFGIGGTLLHDEAGDSQLSLDELTAQAAYHLAVTKNQWVSIGAQVGVAQRRFQTKKLTFDNQYNGDVFDPMLSTRENIPLSDFLFMDYGVSANYVWFYNAHTAVEIGGTALHLDAPQQSFFNQDAVRLPRRFSLNARAQFPLADRLDITLSGNSFFQEKQSETVFSALFNFTLKEETFKKIAIYGGCGLRINDAIIPAVGIQYNQWRAGLCYDITTSNFSKASQGNGGIELTVQHFWYRVPPIKKAKACPVY